MVGAGTLPVSTSLILEPTSPPSCCSDPAAAPWPLCSALRLLLCPAQPPTQQLSPPLPHPHPHPPQDPPHKPPHLVPSPCMRPPPAALCNSPPCDPPWLHLCALILPSLFTVTLLPHPSHTTRALLATLHWGEGGPLPPGSSISSTCTQTSSHSLSALLLTLPPILGLSLCDPVPAPSRQRAPPPVE